jgi:NAD(P)H-quinone oxidoreductase subunit L
VQAEKEEVSSSSSGLPAGLTLSSAVCFLELLSAGAAEAKHPPQVDAAAFFTNLDVNGLFEFGFTSVGFLVFYFLVMPPILLTYFLKRWKKKQLAETFFIFSMVFVFFPGLMLWAPFINTRPFARSTGRYTAETDKAAFRGEDWRQ